MATTSGRRGLIAQEDTKYHDPTVGAVADVFDPSQAGSTQTYSRTSQSGGSVTRTKVSAAHIPIVDAAVVSGAQSPFSGLGASVHNVEAALADIRKNIPHYRNLEHYGCQAGTGVSSTIAAKNTQVWNQIVSDISASGRGGGIFIPNGVFEFGGSSPTLEINSKSNINICGAGSGSVLAANVANATDFLRLTDCSGIQFMDLMLDKRANTAGLNCIVRASAAAISNIGLYSVIFKLGTTGLRLDGASRHGNTFWVRDCTFDTPLTKGVEFIDWSRGRITGSTFNLATPGQMIQGHCAAAGDLLLDCEIASNKSFSTQQSNIEVNSTAATYSSSLHARMDISYNNLSNGDIFVNTIDQPTISHNRMLAGGIAFGFSASAILNAPRFIGNHITNPNFHGIAFTPACTGVLGLEIAGGIISNCLGAGLFLAAPGAGTLSQYARIYGVNVYNCSQAGNGTWSGVRLDAAAAGGWTDSIVTGNVIVSTAAPKHKYGIEEVAGGASTRNMFFGNSIVGWVTAALLGPAAGSVTGANLSTGP